MKGSCKDESHYSKENQRFLDSMKSTEFERKLEFEEKLERKLNHDKYVVGIQGIDGGYFVRDPRDRC